MTTLAQAKSRVDGLFKKYVAGLPTTSLIPPKALAGKVYEAIILGYVIEMLVNVEGLRFQLVGGTKLYLKTAPGPINRAYPYFSVWRDSQHVADLFTDVEFVTLSCKARGNGNPSSPGDSHELDIVIVDPTAASFPASHEIWLGVECKHTTFEKNLLREALGVRREMSLLVEPLLTNFRNWPRKTVPAQPPAALLVCSSDQRVLQYSSPGPLFGIDFQHVPF